MKMMVLFRRRADLTPEQFRDYYETKHTPLALQLFPYLKIYRRNYIRHDLHHQRAGGEALGMRLDFDAITEIGFAGRNDYERMVSDMSDPVVREKVVNDEQQFLDRSATVVFIVDEETTRSSP
jgi:hypothetical protein